MNASVAMSPVMLLDSLQLNLLTHSTLQGENKSVACLQPVPLPPNWQDTH